MMDPPHEVKAEGLGDFGLQDRFVVFQSIPDGLDMHEVITFVPKQDLQQSGVVVEDSNQPQVTYRELNFGTCAVLVDVCWQFQRRLVKISLFSHIFFHGFY
jgi:hypothetical protein